MIELHQQSASATSGTSLEEFETRCGLAACDQRAINWWIGDLALAVERQHPQTFHQAWPVWMSPDHIERCKAVAAAYPPETRNIEATWSVHMQNSKQPNRVALVQAHVDAGHTSDEARKTPVTVKPEPSNGWKKNSLEDYEQMMDSRHGGAATTPAPETPAEPEPAPVVATKEKSRWLLAVDISYYVHAGFEKHGLDTASEVAAWLERTIERLYALGVTDFVCCFDGRDNFRKTLTADWEEKRRYKFKRADKEQELKDQMRLMPELLARNNRPCVFIDTMEADDVMASYCAQFDGRVTMLTKDKDMRQCLKSKKVNMLTDVTWEENTETGVLMPVYHYVNAEKHIAEGLTYQGAAVSGIIPELWPHFQALAGDSGDNIQGVKGIGAKLGMDLILHHGDVWGVIDACKAGTATIFDTKTGEDKPLSKILTQAVLDFEPVADVMLQLTTLKTDLAVPQVTRLSLKQD